MAEEGAGGLVWFGTNATEAVARLGNASRNMDDLVFDRTDVRAIFIVLYSIVFGCCFFGNLLVIVVVTLSRRLRSITNFFLANLAVADLCVGTFCVYQNLSIYLISSWVLGDLVCKMYHFVHYLSHTASVLILVVLCVERYLAILHPMTCKQMLTPTRLRIVIGLVWVSSALYASPRLLWVQTITVNLGRGDTETICIAHRGKYNSETFDLVNFALLYVAPLTVMLGLYTRIAVRLWDSSRGLSRPDKEKDKELKAPAAFAGYPAPGPGGSSPAALSHAGVRMVPVSVPLPLRARTAQPFSACYSSSASVAVLRARRGVIRMLIVVVLTFAICNLPYHARKMWQYWSAQYCGHSTFSSLFTPATFLLTYVNSGVNPLLYAFLSHNFRKGMRELLLCPCSSCSCCRRLPCPCPCPCPCAAEDSGAGGGAGGGGGGGSASFRGRHARGHTATTCSTATSTATAPAASSAYSSAYS